MTPIAACALGLWLGSSKPAQDKPNPKVDIYRRLEAFGHPVRVMEYKYCDDVKRAAWWAEPMTIFVVDGPFEVWQYFRDHGWELIPFRLDGKWIVRKVRTST